MNVTRLIHPTRSGWQWFIYESENGHVFAQGFAKHLGTAKNQTTDSALRLGEELGFEVTMSEYVG